MTKLLFIIKENIKDYEILKDSILDEIIVIDKELSNLDNIKNLQQIKSNKINQIGFLYENIGGNQLPNIGNSLDDFWNLIEFLKKNNETKIIDLITCNINDEKIIEKIENKSNQLEIEIRFSKDETGYLSFGNWLQESHNVNIKSEYFNEDINKWNHTLYLSSISSKICEKINEEPNFLCHLSTLTFASLFLYNIFENINNYPLKLINDQTEILQITENIDTTDSVSSDGCKRYRNR